MVCIINCVILYHMQVDCDNFQDVLPEILHSIEMCDFVAFDCEFTGLVTQLERIEGFFPNHIEFYERIKETAYNFKIIQLGIAAFIYNEGRYQPKVYNIFVSPTTFANKYNNVMVCEVESLQFLAKNGMNFQRTFQKGVKHRRLFENDEIKEHEYNTFLTMTPQKMFLSPQENEIVKKIEQNAISVLKENPKLEKIIDFWSKTVLNYIKMRHPDLFIYQPKKKQGKFQYVAKIKHKTENIEEMHKMEVEEQEKKSPTLEIIFQTIIKMRKPLVGHFPNLDLGLIYHNLLKNLPDSYEEFCYNINQLFPYVFDTKVLSRRIQKKVKGIKVDLSSLFKACFNPKLLQDYISLRTEEIEGYLQGEHHHEAGYDALMTGCAFAGMANFMASKNGRVTFEHLQGQNKLLYSRFSGQVSINGNKFCSGALEYDNTIVIQSLSQKQTSVWKPIAQILSHYGSLSVHQDRQEIYFVFEQPQNIPLILSNNKKFELHPYCSRKIIKARNMFANN